MKYLLPFTFAILLLSCSSEELPKPGPNPTPTPTDSLVVWSGDILTFTKEAGADPSQESNQDRISDNVWLTRGNDGGQIYNAASESSADKDNSPLNTRWAIGAVDSISNLTFMPFRAAVGSPKDVVDKDLILYLTEEDVYIPLTFTSWDAGKSGGFAYVRATE